MSANGVELTFATNVLGPFLLTNLLLPLLEHSAPARIINVSSGGMYTQRITLDDLQSERAEFDGPTAYTRTKRAQSSSPRSGRSALRAVASWSTRCTPSGPTFRALRLPSRGSTE
jgi:NAD(P)-dependent dehydrogenase (short-subunit alcohol dehydrogenase family)